MNIKDFLAEFVKVKEGSFDDLNIFSFYGVYLICDENDEIVYIGSAYARTINIRLSQYLSPSDTGNTLGKSIAKNLSNSKTYGDEAKKRISEACEKIKKYKIYAIEHKDLEYKIINIAKPKYNNLGKEMP